MGRIRALLLTSDSTAAAMPAERWVCRILAEGDVDETAAQARRYVDQSGSWSAGRR